MTVAKRLADASRAIARFYARAGKAALIFGAGFFAGCLYTGLLVGMGWLPQ